jgi:hypothetical protein
VEPPRGIQRFEYSVGWWRSPEIGLPARCTAHLNDSSDGPPWMREVVDFDVDLNDW